MQPAFEFEHHHGRWIVNVIVRFMRLPVLHVDSSSSNLATLLHVSE